MSETAALARVLPEVGPGETPDPDEVLERFVGWVAETGLELYDTQEEAILELLSGKHVVLDTPTGSGKSLVALALHFKALAEGRRSFYTSPIKALVNEKFFALCAALGPERVGLMTGDASINTEAPVICCTAEVLANLALRGESGADYVVMDEFHYYGDRDRGMAWQIPLVALKDSTFLLMSATLGNVAPITEPVEAYTGRAFARVHSTERPVPLSYDYRETPLHETIEWLLAQGEAPIYLVNFTQRECPEQAQNLMSVDLCSKEEKQALADALGPERFDTPQGKELSRFLRHGIGLHHAGLLPRYRRLVERLAQQGLLKVLSGTDTLGVGVNIPLRTVLLRRLYKYDGEKTRLLQVREFRQIAGRAGRKGYDDHGRVVVQAPEHVIENIRLDQKAARRPDLKKKIVKKKPERGFVGWDETTFRRMIEAPPELLEPVFDPTHGLILEVLQSAGAEPDGGWRRILGLIERSHQPDAMKKRHRQTAAQRVRALRHAGVVETPRRPEGGSRLAVNAELQEDFSLNHTLSLWLLDTLQRLDFQAEDYGLKVLSVVEAILENPRPVLYKQLDKLKGDLVARLKAEGMEYEERMEELQKLDHPKPEAEFIYGSFDAFAEKHPWVAHEDIRPKSVAREMYERLAGFNDYVSEYGLQRSEGVLLRYLSDTYKTLLQSVPEALQTEQVADVVAFLRDLLRRTDASLIEEWERMQGIEVSGQPLEPEAPPSAPRRLDPARDFRAFAARVRQEAWHLVKHLAEGDWEAALGRLRQDRFPWTAEDLEGLMAPYFEEHPSVDLTPRARQPRHTLLKEGATPQEWTVQQSLVDPEGEADWYLLFGIDVSDGPEEEESPFLELVDVRH